MGWRSREERGKVYVCLPPQSIRSCVGRIFSLYLLRWVATGGGAGGRERRTIGPVCLVSASNVVSWVSVAQLALAL